jgi:hypothetical protein
MECQQTQPFVSAIHDGQAIPRAAAEHIRACAVCSQRLKDYGEIGAQLRLMASLASESEPKPLSVSPPARAWRARWKHILTGRVLMPRFALGLGVLVILALSAKLGVIWAGRGESFQFQVTSPGSSGSLGGELEVGADGDVQLGGLAPSGFWVAKFKLLGVEKGVVRLDVQNHNFEAEPKTAEVRQAMATAAHHVYEYVPGQTLEIPVEDGDTLTLVGKLAEKQPEINTPKLASNDIEINRPVLFRDGKLVADAGGMIATASTPSHAEESAVAILIPKEGRYFFMLNPMEGAVQGEAYFGQLRFQLAGKDYLLASATAITGGEQPRRIWIYHDQWTSENLSHVTVAAGPASGLMEKQE